jgi:hypothetical protein
MERGAYAAAEKTARRVENCIFVVAGNECSRVGYAIKNERLWVRRSARYSASLLLHLYISLRRSKPPSRDQTVPTVHKYRENNGALDTRAIPMLFFNSSLGLRLVGKGTGLFWARLGPVYTQVRVPKIIRSAVKYRDILALCSARDLILRLCTVMNGTRKQRCCYAQAQHQSLR